MERGAVVLAYLSAPQDSLGRALPNLVGLTVRDAIRRLSQRAVEVRISGSGFVTRQEPPPGTPLPLSGPCRLWCSPGESEVVGSGAARSPSLPPPQAPVAARLRRP